tara:strand:- start:1357 stop:1563 length:207 start_codon:yes stop_codon:yes gene_type:complete
MVKKDYRIRVWDDNAISIDTDNSSYYAEITEQGVLNANSFQCEHLYDSTQYKVLRDKMCKLSEFILKP